MEDMPQTNIDAQLDVIGDFRRLIAEQSIASAVLFEDVLQQLANKEGENEV